MKKICKVSNCNRKHFALGYCQMHWHRVKRHGNPLINKGIKHGKRNTPEYHVWINLKGRCYNPNNHKYHRYGGRGIIVCDRWKNSFINFYSDMGKKPFPKAQIDRIDNNGNYEPNNCHWVTPFENSINKSTTKLTMDIANEIRYKYSLGDTSHRKLASLYGVNKTHIQNIIKNKTWII